MNDVEKSIERLYKDKYGQLISLILHRFRSLSVSTAEDIVQEVFSDATLLWAKDGMPHNPAGWLYQSCRNKSINLLKKTSREEYSAVVESIAAPFEEISDDGFKDAQLQMLLACCHPHLTPKTQVTLALKYVANLKVESIALQLGVSLDAVEKMLYRARQKIKDKELVLSSVHDPFPRERLSRAHKAIYLIFNEGYKQADEKVGLGKALCEEALILNQLLLDSRLSNSETKALQALMLFNTARFDARFDSSGNAIELEYQDRSLWNGALIRLARQLLMDAEDTAFSPYHLEAAIALVHCAAPRFEATDWEAICRYYEALLKIYPSPFAEINYAVALQYNRQDEKAYRILMELHRNPFYSKLPLLETSIQKYRQRKGLKD